MAPIGLMLWGGGLQERLHYMVPIVGTAITYGVLCAVPAVAMTYVVDSYRALAGETMTVLTAFKNTFAFGLGFAVFPWLAKDGFVKVGFGDKVCTSLCNIWLNLHIGIWLQPAH